MRSVVDLENTKLLWHKQGKTVQIKNKNVKWIDTFYLVNSVQAIKLDHRLKYLSKSEVGLQSVNFDLGAASFCENTFYTDMIIHCFTMIFSTNVIRL